MVSALQVIILNIKLDDSEGVLTKCTVRQCKEVLAEGKIKPLVSRNLKFSGDRKLTGCYNTVC